MHTSQNLLANGHLRIHIDCATDEQKACSIATLQPAWQQPSKVPHRLVVQKCATAGAAQAQLYDLTAVHIQALRTQQARMSRFRHWPLVWGRPHSLAKASQAPVSGKVVLVTEPHTACSSGKLAAKPHTACDSGTALTVVHS